MRKTGFNIAAAPIIRCMTCCESDPFASLRALAIASRIVRNGPVATFSSPKSITTFCGTLAGSRIELPSVSPLWRIVMRQAAVSPDRPVKAPPRLALAKPTSGSIDYPADRRLAQEEFDLLQLEIDRIRPAAIGRTGELRG